MGLSLADAVAGRMFEQVVVDDLTRTQIVMYAGASGDFNPIHTDEVYVREVAGYPGVFAHGMLTMGATGKALTDLVGADRLRSYGGRFRAQVWPGDTLTARLTVVSVVSTDAGHVVELAVVTTNQRGEEVFTGTATAAVDG
jgi:acyl dehydratase